MIVADEMTEEANERRSASRFLISYARELPSRYGPIGAENAR